MADNPPTATPSSGSQGDRDAALVVNLQIVSPSRGVGPLWFPGLPAATTVQQLKERIRETLASRPADENQRLIHRGRLLRRDTDTLQDVLGEEAIRTSDQQTIHLVVHDVAEHSAPNLTPAQGTPNMSPSPTPANIAARPDLHAHVQNLREQAQMMRNLRPSSAPIGVPHAAPNLNHQHHHQHQQHQELMQRMHQLQQREASYRHLLAQQQNHRAAMAQHIPHYPPAFPPTLPQGHGPDLTGGRNSPLRPASQVVTHEGIGPDGQHYSFRITVNEVFANPGAIPHPPTSGPTSNPMGHRPFSSADVHTIMHGADATRAAQAMTSAMQRNASGPAPAHMAADLANFNYNNPIQPIQPGVTTPIFPGLSRNASRTGTPDPSSRSVSYGSGSLPTMPQPQLYPQPQQGHPEVYILSSPTGPRGLLINNGSEMYATPNFRPTPWTPNYYRLPNPLAPLPHVAQAQYPMTMPIPGQAEAQIDAPAMPQPQQPQLAPQPHLQPQPQPQPQAHIARPPGMRRVIAERAGVQPGPQLRAHANPGAGALAAAAWPHIWLLVRLVAFAWWFSYTNPSWERWLSLIVAFFVVFAINTGFLNNVVHNAFHPVREQLEGMIPFADPNRPEGQEQGQQGQQQGQQQNQQGGAGGVGQNQTDGFDPAQVAARLVAQRQAENGNWLREQMRRIERASILFLASFAPGVAERHIQQLEERERAERRAAEEARAAAERAAAEAAEQAAQQAEEGNGEGQEGQEGQAGQAGQQNIAATTEGAAEQQQQQDRDQLQPQPPLVQV